MRSTSPSSFAVEHVKAVGYNELANLALIALTKVSRASERSDVDAIVRDYFSKSISAMRRVGLAVKTADIVFDQPTRGLDNPAPRRHNNYTYRAPENFGSASIGERLKNRR